MKKLLAMFAAVMIICTMIANAADISVFIDGEQINFDVKPQMINDRTMVPMRVIFEKLGTTVMFDEETETISAYRSGSGNEGTIIIIQAGNAKGFVNSNTYNLDSPPVIIDDRTLVPVRFIGEALGCTVDWNEATQTVNIKSNTAPAAAETEDK